MRVIAGKYKRRLLVTPDGATVTRPTADRVKESIFNILQNDVSGKMVIDLFSGSGSLGIEALSRGAAHVSFVESHPAALRCIQENLEKLRIPKETYRILSTEVENFLDPTKRKLLRGWNEEDFAVSTDLIFADPPYASPWYDQAVESIERSGLCRDNCLLVLEMSSKRILESDIRTPWEKVDERVYGAARIEFWKKDSSEVGHEQEGTRHP